MPFDAIFLSAVTQELQQPLQGAKVDKIYQPERDTLVLQLRGSQGAKRLLLTANPAHPRLQLTALSLENQGLHAKMEESCASIWAAAACGASHSSRWSGRSA